MVAVWIGLGVTILTAASAIIGVIVRTSSRFAVMQRDIADLERDLEKQCEHNAKQHEELYNSRNGMAESIAKLTALMEVMAGRIEAMDAKIDMIVRRGDR